MTHRSGTILVKAPAVDRDEAGSIAVPLADLYGPVAKDLAVVERIFDEELISEFSFVNSLCETVRSYRGKMMRPALLLLVGKATGGVAPDHHTLAAVVEMVHMATLVHDDVLDEADERRGKQPVHSVSGNIAAVLLETVRSVDVPGRWGGDEFLVVLPDTSAAHAERLAARLRQRVRDRPATADDQAVVTSLSIGVADYQKDESPEALVRRVDQAMYAAKNGGRDRITTADPAE